MDKIIQYWYTDGKDTRIETQPPKNIYNYDYITRFKLKAKAGHMLYNTRFKIAQKIVIIFPEEEKEWIEISFEELQNLKASIN